MKGYWLKNQASWRISPGSIVVNMYKVIIFITWWCVAT